MDFSPLKLFVIPAFLLSLSVPDIITCTAGALTGIYTAHQYYDYLKNKRKNKE